MLLLLCVIIAMLLANLPATRHYYHAILETSIQIHMQSPEGSVDWLFPHGMTIEKLINDILMVVFFFTVGLEIKREVAHGELSSVKKALLPVVAAFGGVIMPALLYTLVNRGTIGASGWGIPTATDNNSGCMGVGQTAVCRIFTGGSIWNTSRTFSRLDSQGKGSAFTDIKCNNPDTSVNVFGIPYHDFIYF